MGAGFLYWVYGLSESIINFGKINLLNMEELLDQCKEWVSDGKDYDWIKAQLEQERALSPEDRKHLLKKVDELIVQFQLWENRRSNHLNRILIGLVLFALGLAITLSTYFEGLVYTYLAYVAMLSGAYLMWVGYKKYQEPIPMSSYKRIKKRQFKRF